MPINDLFNAYHMKDQNSVVICNQENNITPINLFSGCEILLLSISTKFISEKNEANINFFVNLLLIFISLFQI